MKITELYIIFSLFYLINNSFNIISIDDLEKSIKNTSHSQEYYKNIIKNVMTIMEYYVYIDVAKSPPQPNFDRNYFPKINILNELNKIKTNNTNDYEFKQGLKHIISKLRDLNIKLDFSTKFDNIILYPPIKLVSNFTNNAPKMYGRLYIHDFIFTSLFSNDTQTLNTIKRNENVALSSINNLNPFDFIENFGGVDLRLHNSHSTYTHKYSGTEGVLLGQIMLKIDEIKYFNVTYENGDVFNLSYALCSFSLETQKEQNKSINFFENNETEKKFIEFLCKNTKSKNKNPIGKIK